MEKGKFFWQGNHLRNCYSNPSKKWHRPTPRQEQWKDGEKESALGLQFSSVQSDSLWPHGLQHARPPCPSPTPGVYQGLTIWARYRAGEGRERCHKFLSSKTVWVATPFAEIGANIFIAQGNSDWLILYVGFPGGSEGRVPPQCQRPGFKPWVGKIPWRREWLPIPVWDTFRILGM